MMARTVIHLAILTLVASAVLATNLGAARLWDRDEPRNAGCAREMLARGDWVTPWFNDEIRTHKPVLLYWFIMSAYGLFGDGEFAARLPSAVLGLGTVLWTYVIGRRLFGAAAGFLAGLALSVSLMFDVAGRAATPDSCLIFFVTTSLGCFVLGAFTGHDPSGPGWEPSTARLPLLPMLSTYGGMALAVLAKGPVGLILPAAIILFTAGMANAHVAGKDALAMPFLSRVRNQIRVDNMIRSIRMIRPGMGLLVIVAIAAPWYLAVDARSDGEFTRGFFLDHNLERAMQSREGHGGSVWYYPVAMLAGFFPSSVFAAPALLEFCFAIRRSENRRTVHGLYLVLGWVVIWVGAFSLARTKLPSYVTPCYPALAIVTGWMLDRWRQRRTALSDRWLYAAFGSSAVVGILFTLLLPRFIAPQFPGEGWLGWLGLILVISGGVAFGAAVRKQRGAAVVCHFLGATTFCGCMFGLGPVAADRHQSSQRLLEPIRAVGQPAEVYSYGCLEPSWVYYLGRPIHELALETATAAPTSDFPRYGRRGANSLDDLRQSSSPVFVITTNEKLLELELHLGRDFQPVVTIPHFLKKDQVVLLQRNSAATAVAERPLAARSARE
ncbi:MAG: glycosyltransferase family 39 protein [Planctomycetes bacterium]|nr:glycosyltransferase family 39 protein [Planctomycetota bacterium]